MFNKVLNILDSVIKNSLMVLMAAIVLTVVWQVLSRYLLQSPSSGSEELARFCLIWIGMLGAVYCYRVKAHLGLDILVNKLENKQQKKVQLICQLLVIYFSVSVLIIGGFELVSLTLQPVQISPALAIKVAYVYSIVPISGVLMTVYALGEVVGLISKKTVYSEANDGV